MKYQMSNVKYQISNKGYWKLVIGYLILVFILAQSASAQETVRNITISPPTVEISAPPGGYKERSLKVINDSTVPLTFSVYTRDFIVEDTKGTPKLLPPDTLSNKYSAATWMGVSPQTFTIEAGSQQIIDYFVQVPANAGAGGHYAAVLFQPLSTVKVEGTGAAVNTFVGSLFYINVEGPITESANIVSFFANRFQEYGPVKVSTLIGNSGDLHIRPEGSISLFDILGRRVEIEGLKEQNIFPGVSREYENEAGGKLMIGRYKAQLLASYGQDNNLPLTATLTFWVFPWRIALLLILIAVAIVLSALYFRRRKDKESNPTTNEPEKTPREPPSASATKINE